MKKYVIAAGLCLVAVAAYADTKISQMPSGGTLTTGDVIPILRGGSNFQATYTPSAGAVSSITGDGLIYNNSLSTGAVTMSLGNQSANVILAGPATGTATTPTFRPMVAADLPATVNVLSSITAATGTAAIDNAGNPVTWNWSNTGNNSDFSLVGTTTGSGKTLSVTTTGAANTGYAGYFTNTSTGGYAAYITGILGISGRAFVTPVSPTLSTNTFTPDFAASNHFDFGLVHASCPCIIANPLNPVAGQSGVIEIDQSSTGSDTVTWGSSYKFAGGSALSTSTTASATDFVGYYVKDSTHIVVGSGVLNAH